MAVKQISASLLKSSADESMTGIKSKSKKKLLLPSPSETKKRQTKDMLESKKIKDQTEMNRIIYRLPAPNCIKDFLDLPDDTGQLDLTLQLFPVVILVNQVWRYNCFH